MVVIAAFFNSKTRILTRSLPKWGDWNVSTLLSKSLVYFFPRLRLYTFYQIDRFLLKQTLLVNTAIPSSRNDRLKITCRQGPDTISMHCQCLYTPLHTYKLTICTLMIVIWKQILGEKTINHLFTFPCALSDAQAGVLKTMWKNLVLGIMISLNITGKSLSKLSNNKCYICLLWRVSMYPASHWLLQLDIMKQYGMSFLTF